jgi:hypothetical protein
MTVDELIDALIYARDTYLSPSAQVEVRNIHLKNHPIGVVTGVRNFDGNRYKMILDYEPI